ncbi:MAG: hypothetical protein RIR48_3380, partial [Bacteroidota bacterium]
MNRRKVIKDSMLAAGMIISAGQPLSSQWVEPSDGKLKSNINHSVCRWTYGHLSLEKLCLLVKKIGFNAIDLIGPNEWDILKKHGIDSSMCNGAEIGLTKGWNDKQYHDTLIKNYTEHIELVSKAGYKNLICFSGNRNG